VQSLLGGAFAVVVLGLASSCASTRTDPCDDVRHPRPFGRRFLAFFDMVGNAPQVVADDVTCRTARTGRNLARLWKVKEREFALTGQHLSEAFPVTMEKFVDRSKITGKSMAKRAQNAYDDSRCFFGRAWYTLKHIE
jgi:hypothetical protein